MINITIDVCKGASLEEDKNSIEYALKYFDLHAKQRMTVINFFFAIAGALIGLIAASLGGYSKYPLAALALSIFLLSLIYLFGQLDIRTSFLIKHAETSLEISEKILFENHARLVGSESVAFTEFRKRSFGLAKGLSYSNSLRFIFALTSMLATVGTILSIGEIVEFDPEASIERMKSLCQIR